MALAAPERMAVAADEQHRAAGRAAARPRGLRARRRPRRPPATRRCPAASASQHRRVGHAVCRRAPRARLPRSTTAQSALNSDAHALDEAAPQLGRVGRRRHTRSTVSSASSRVGKALDALPLLDRRAVDLFDLAHEQLHEIDALRSRPRTRRPRRVRCARARRRRRCRRRSRRCATRRARARPDGRAATPARRGGRRSSPSGESRVVVMPRRLRGRLGRIGARVPSRRASHSVLRRLGR